MNLFVRTVRGLSLVCGVIAAGLIAAAVVVVCQMVFIRYVLNDNTIWQTDFVTFGLVGATFIGAPYVLMTKGHVGVDVVPLMVGERARFWLAVVATILSFAFALAMTVLTFQLWREAWENNWVSESMWRARLWIPYAAMPIGLGVLSLQYIADFVQLLARGVAPLAVDAPREAER